MHWIPEQHLKVLSVESPSGLAPNDDHSPVGTVLRNSETGERWVRMMGRDGKTLEWRLLHNEDSQATSQLIGRLDALQDTLSTMLGVQRSIQHGIAILVDEDDLTPK